MIHAVRTACLTCVKQAVRRATGFGTIVDAMLEIDGAHGEGGESSFTARALTSHARTAMWLIERFLPVRFVTQTCDGRVRVQIRA